MAKADYTIREAAELLGVTAGRVHQLRREGRLGKGVKRGTFWLLPGKAVEAFAKLDRPSGNPNFGRVKAG